MNNAEEHRKTVRQLRRRGFDLTKSFRSGLIRPACSQCQALVINGVACHEAGCPRPGKVRRDRD